MPTASFHRHRRGSLGAAPHVACASIPVTNPVPRVILALVDAPMQALAAAAIQDAVPSAVIDRVRSLDELQQALAGEDPPALVLCCCRFASGAWREAASRVERRSEVPIFVLVLPDDQPAPDLRGSAVDELLWLRDREWARLPLLLKRWTRRVASARSIDAQERLGLMLRAVKAGTWDWDIASDTVSWTEDTAALAGLAAESYRGSMAPFFDVLVPEDRPVVVEAIRRAVEGTEPYSVEYRVRRPDGEVQWMMARGHVFRSAGGQPLRMLGVSIDVTEFRETLEALDAVRERNRLIAELATEAIFFYDADMRVEFVNPAGLEMLGRSWDELRGMTIRDLVPADFGDRLELELARRRAGNTDRVVFPATRGDGTRIWVQSSGRPVLGPDGSVRAHLAVATDITGRVVREEQLQQALSDREALLREVHHRVRNNFQIIVSLLNLQFNDVDSAALQDRVRDMQNRIMTMALLHSLLYRSEDASSVPVDAYLDEVLGALRRSFGDRASRITIDLDVQPLRLSIDHCMRFGLIVNELVTNALKHAFPSGTTGTVRVALAPEPGPRGGGPLVLSVTDDGVGLPAAAEPAPGLGLQLVRDLAVQLGGTLSMSAGPGATVRVMFPPAFGAAS
ncbi:MAG: PAS domain S-box protein [Vicinamibacterales bacterium]|nr:PAS domain S-box protein [Vicinamibacterales bacterium]